MEDFKSRIVVEAPVPTFGGGGDELCVSSDSTFFKPNQFFEARRIHGMVIETRYGGETEKPARSQTRSAGANGLSRPSVSLGLLTDEQTCQIVYGPGKFDNLRGWDLPNYRYQPRNSKL